MVPDKKFNRSTMSADVSTMFVDLTEDNNDAKCPHLLQDIVKTWQFVQNLQSVEWCYSANSFPKKEAQ